ncbi:hypothetical protein GPJ56_007623 [Histomonas meleagridis]|uniref:uncharacterized protein n=1 Tax=Histomonas meleagridis TaxID=135588 RepID=UPI00355AC213|nr:hypothetical protein GPJ56_007623 [Histomonas meleagridis]KAH0803587.1 hypothetical protein GO595_003638 [Histomonas meleagridis]
MKLSNSLTNVLYLSNYKTLSIYSSDFKNFLSSPIKVDSESIQYYKLSYNETLSINNNQTTIISRCLFINCTNRDTGGGAIYFVSNVQNSYLNINCSGFINCTSPQEGGSIYADMFRIRIDYICFEESTSPINDMAIYANYHCHISDIQVSSGGDGEFANRVSSLKSLITKINVTNRTPSTLFDLSSYTSEIYYLTVHNVSTNSLFSVKETTLIFHDSIITDSNFSGNLISFEDSKALIVMVLFVNVQSENVSLTNSIITLDACYVNDPKLFANVTHTNQLSEPNPNLTFTNNLNSDICWIGHPTWDTSLVHFEMNASSFSFMLLCVAIVLLYLYMRKKIKEEVDNAELNEEDRDKLEKDEELLSIEDIEDVPPPKNENISKTK